MTKREIINAIYQVTKQDDLREIQEAVRLHWGTLQSRAATTFAPKDEVSFVSGKTVHFGAVVKVNRKTVSVKTIDGRTWRVSPTLLQRKVV